MAHFIGAIEGNRGSVTRIGTPNSGIRTVAHGWNVGVNVRGRKEDDGDVFTIYADSGSNVHAPGFCVGTVRLVDGKVTFIPAEKGD